MNSTQLLKATLAGALAVGMTATASMAFAQTPMKMTAEQMKMQQEKTMNMVKKNHLEMCYGVNAAYKNDCQSPGHSCAGQDSVARDANGFVAMPAGLCGKIDGGTIKSM